MNQPKDKPTFFEKYAVKPVKDQVSRWLTPSQEDNQLIDLVDANLSAIEKEFGSLSEEPKKTKRKPTPTDKNYLSQQRGPNGRFLSKKSAPVTDKVTVEEMPAIPKPAIKEQPESFSKVAILAGNYVKSIDTDAKYTANDIREALIWGLNNHGGTMLPSKKAALYMRDRGIS
jgi:hypothetical protein